MATTDFLDQLELIIAERLSERPQESYTVRLASRGLPKVAQKVGEEAVEVVLAAVTENEARLTEEAADLIYHLVLLLRLKSLTLADVVGELERRHRAAS